MSGTYANIYQTLGWQARRRPSSPALVDAERSLTFPALLDMVQSAALRLEDKGIRHGDRVVVLADNCIETIALLHATALLGFIMVPVNTRYSPAELQYVLGNAEPALVLYGPAYEALLGQATQDMPMARMPIGQIAEPVAAERLSSWRAALGFEASAYGRVDGDDVAMLIYTSGTTSHPKGAMLTHGNLIWNSINYIMESELRAAHSAILATPLFHISGFGVMHGPLLHAGGTLYIVDRFSPQRILDALETFRPTHLFLVSAMWVQMTETPAFLAKRFEDVTFVSTAAGPLSAARQMAVRNAFPNAQFGWGYGMTESCVTTIKSQRTEEIEQHPGTLGYGWRHVRYRLVDESGQVLPSLLGTGELQVKGDVVFKGYWKNPEATQEARPEDGWLRSGDLFEFDADGFAYFRGRSKDMVKTGGENVAAQEVEQCVIQCPGVRDAAAFGIPDDHLGELLAVAIEVQAGASPSENEIKAWCRNHLAGFKVPKKVFFVDALPRSSSEKPQKHKLVEMFK
ncbi:MAG: acyl--CoA ligase [Burkholderiales bacterium]|nr:acyl--CoA ligase [Burkholderiales bacterium]